MKKYANFMILPEFSLILECCKGKALVQDAIEMKKTELADELYDPDYNIIVDFREFETTLDSKTNESTIDFFNFLKSQNIRTKIAILTSAPHQVVISLILKDLIRKLGSTQMEVFSTVEAAFRFLGITVESFDLINRKILELSKNTSAHPAI